MFFSIMNCPPVLRGATTGLEGEMMDVSSVVSLCNFLKAVDAFSRTICRKLICSFL